MIATPGNFILSVLGNDKANEESVIERLTTNNIFAPMQKDGRCEYVCIINNSNKGIKKEEIIKLVGTPRRTFEGFGSDKVITVVCG